MKKSSIIFSSLLLIPFAILFLVGNFSNDTKVERQYSSKTISKNLKAKSWNDAREHYHSLYQDETTGEIDAAQYVIAKQEVLNLMLQKSGAFTFVEEGPDNVGGRTRGLAIKPGDDNIIYAGGISGGLFNSTDAGNSWNRVQGYDDAVNDAINGNGSISISSIAVSFDGHIYVATGGSIFNEQGLSV